ncbi:putative uncharacterized protein [Pseudomonas sp. StFLB209]|nr:putative uncharacterized protein [Pseudomonas sp. StFLB209]
MNAFDARIGKLDLHVGTGMQWVLLAGFIQAQGQFDALHADPVQRHQSGGDFSEGYVGEGAGHDGVRLVQARVYSGIGLGLANLKQYNIKFNNQVTHYLFRLFLLSFANDRVRQVRCESQPGILPALSA